MLRESYERELNRIRASAMFILKSEKRAGLIRIFNERWDRYNKYVGEITARCRDEGIKVSADTETAYLFEHITGPETEREKPPAPRPVQQTAVSARPPGLSSIAPGSHAVQLSQALPAGIRVSCKG